MVSLIKKITVDVSGQTYRYADVTGAYRAHVAEAGTAYLGPSSLQAAIKAGRSLPKGFLNVYGWVTLDDSGLVYHVSVARSGNHTIMGAARPASLPVRGRYADTWAR